MKNKYKEVSVKTEGEYDFIDITDNILGFVDNADVKNGIVNVQTFHTTTSIIVNENEPLLIKDMKESLERIAPKSNKYNHDNFDVRTVNMCDGECANGHSHCKAITMPTSVSLNLVDGELKIGQWQRVFLLELDRSRPRKYQIHILGE